MSSPVRDEAITNPVTTLTTDVGQNSNQTNVQVPMSLSFNVDTGDYNQFIHDIRDRLRDRLSHGIPVLIPQSPETPANARWMDIELVSDKHSVTVRLEQSNLYVRGYKRGTDKFFWEFKDTKLITGSRDMKFSGSYVESDSVEKTAKVNREKLLLGGTPLKKAVLTLLRLETPVGTNNQVAAESLLVLIQMISESARFRSISDHIVAHYKQGVKISTEMLYMEKGWSKLSTAVLQLDPNPTPTTRLPNIPADTPSGVSTFGQAFAALGIMLIERPRGGLAMMVMSVGNGRSLMNLEYVRVKNAGDLYGTVIVDDGWYTYTFYDRSSGHSEKVGPGRFATLTDSSHPFPVSGADTFVISVEKIAQGKIVWDRFVESVTFGNYDKHLQQVVKGSHGDVTVGYSVLSNALGVTIHVILVHGDDKKGAAEINGTVRASQVLGGSAGLAPITLFNKPSKECVKVGQGKPIPLTRKVIAASTTTKLTVSADLLSTNNVIAQGSVDFTVQPGTQKHYIDGRYGQVQVIITCE